MKPQVIVYSLSGHTRRVADEIAQLTGAGLSVIDAPAVRGGPFAMLRLGFATLFGTRTAVSLITPVPGDCDLAILAAPVWASRVAVPMRSWLALRPHLPARVALVMTGGAPGTNNMAITDFARRAGINPVAQLYIGSAALDAGQQTAAIAAFCERLGSGRPAPAATVAVGTVTPQPAAEGH